MEREKEKEKREEEWELKHEEVRCAKTTFLKGGEKVLIKGKWSRHTQN
jgi:hypothetical protein